MYKSLFALAVFAVLGMVQTASAEEPSFRADRKISGEYFRPHTVTTYYRGAIQHAESLDYYELSKKLEGESVDAKTLAAFYAEIAKELKAAEAENDKLKATLGVAEPPIKKK